jgi:hypothetical protein
MPDKFKRNAKVECWMLDTGYWMLDTGYWICVVSLAKLVLMSDQPGL